MLCVLKKRIVDVKLMINMAFAYVNPDAHEALFSNISQHNKIQNLKFIFHLEGKSDYTLNKLN